jgi:hypothetical protein
MSVHHERLIRSMLESLEPGCPVVTADGEQIGTLQDVTEEAIHVDAPLRRDFWLGADCVRGCDNGRVELSFIKQDLEAYKLDAARAADTSTPKDPIAGSKADYVVSDEEQLATRLRMEQQLADQRQELPHIHPRGEEGPPDTFGTFGEPVEEELHRFGFSTGDRRGEHATDSPAISRGEDKPSYGRFIAVAAALVPFLAAAWVLSRRRR